MREAREWLYVADDIQRQVCTEFGHADSQAAMWELRTAHVRFPELRGLSVYARNNLARDGDLREGEAVPEVRGLYRLGSEGSARGTLLQDVICPRSPATVLFC